MPLITVFQWAGLGISQKQFANYDHPPPVGNCIEPFKFGRQIRSGLVGLIMALVSFVVPHRISRRAMHQLTQ